MMKKITLFTLLSMVFLLVSCKKDKPSEPEPIKSEVLIQEITARLANADSISTFIQSFRQISLNAEEVAQGITIFAPLNDAASVPAKTSKVAAINVRPGAKVMAAVPDATSTMPDSVLKDHIVKGVFNLADLTNGKVLTGLSGKQLKVTKTADTIWINGVRIGNKQVLSGNNEAVYAVKSRLNGTTVNDELKPRAFTEIEFNTALTAVDIRLSAWHKTLTLTDGLLSRQAIVDSIALTLNKAAYREFNNYTYQPQNPVVTELWQQGYYILVMLEALQSRVPATLGQRAEKLATISAYEGYVYLQLLSYFDNISLLKPQGKFTNTNKTEVWARIHAAFQKAKAALPNTKVPGFKLNTHIVAALQARAALKEKKFTEVAALTDEIINSNLYSLANRSTVFNDESSEMMWNNSDQMDASIKSYFFNRLNLPYLRLTEVYMIGIEANLALGNQPKAQALYNTVTRGVQTDPVTQTGLRQLWAVEMRREGNGFINALRWETAGTLSAWGFKAGIHNRLPIPMADLLQNPGMLQNPGY